MQRKWSLLINGSPTNMTQLYIKYILVPINITGRYYAAKNITRGRIIITIVNISFS